MNNKDIIVSNIEEAREELENILSKLTSKPEYSEVEFKIALEHVYHHLNFLWNIRNVEKNSVLDCSEKDFIK